MPALWACGPALRPAWHCSQHSPCCLASSWQYQGSGQGPWQALLYREQADPELQLQMHAPLKSSHPILAPGLHPGLMCMHSLYSAHPPISHAALCQQSLF